MSQAKPDAPVKRSEPRVVLLATDRSQSIIGEIVDGQTKTIAYSAYGEQSAQQNVETRLGFNGQLREANTRWYLLGNGYRAYNPRLMRFHSPDSWSPFGGGGLNAYMYCVGDPVNHADPTGHWGAHVILSSAQSLGIAGYLTSSLGAGLNIGSTLINGGRSTLQNTLGTISGLTGMAAGLSSMYEIVPQASLVLSATSLISGAASTYLGYRAMRGHFRYLGWYEAPFSRPPNSPPAYFDLYPQPGTSRIMPPSPPPYRINRSMLLPASASAPPPTYSRQDPNLFTMPLIAANNSQQGSTTLPPIGVFGTVSPRYQFQRRQEVLNKIDGIPASTTIRQRR